MPMAAPWAREKESPLGRGSSLTQSIPGPGAGCRSALAMAAASGAQGQRGQDGREIRRIPDVWTPPFFADAPRENLLSTGQRLRAQPS